MATLTSTAATKDLNRSWLRASALGAIVWTAAVALLGPGLDSDGRTLAGIQLLLSPLALLPLAVALIRLDSATRFGRITVWSQLPAAVLLVAAFAVPAGSLAAVLTAPWLAFTLLLALVGLARLTERQLWTHAELAVTAGLIYVAVGGAWTFASRLGRGFLGFEEPIVLLTGAHFHYAGLLLLILTGLGARQLRDAMAKVACIAVIISVPAVAVGITLAAQGMPLPELLAAIVMTVTGFIIATLQFRLARRAKSPLPSILFALSGISLFAGMALGAAYALGHYTHADWLTIPQMIRYHAVINVFGFALPGLLAWHTSPEPGA